MEKIIEIIDRFPLDEKKKINLSELLSSRRIYSIKIIQNKAYISLEKGKVVVLKNVSSEIEHLLVKIEKFSNEILTGKNSDYEPKERTRIDWREEEIEFLIENCNKYNNRELGEMLSKTFYQIQAKKISLKLYPLKIWTTDEIRFLEENLEKPLEYLSEKLDRSIAAVKAKKKFLLRKDKSV